MQRTSFLLPALLFLPAFIAYAAISLRAPGAGVDPDAWRIILAGLRWQQSGDYVPSRPPGFPVVEALAALTSPLGMNALKLLTAAAGAACVSLTYLLAATYSRRGALLAAMLFGCCPALVIASTSTMDYVWALAFTLLALRMSQCGHPIFAGLAFGLAGGCRITAIGLLPVAFTLLPARNPSRKGAIVSMSTTAGLVVMSVFLLVRWAHPTIVAESQNRVFMPSISLLWQAPTVLLGHTGSVVLLFCLMLAIASLFWIGRTSQSRLTAKTVLPALLMIAITLGIYLPAAYEPAYLLPALPALFILLAARLPRPVTAALCVCLLVMNYRDYGPDGLTYGAVAQDLRDRREQARIADAFLTSPPSPPALVIAGSRAPILLYRISTSGRPFPRNVEVDYLLRRADVTARLQPAQQLYCLHDMLPPCRARGFDPLELGAQVWRPPPRP